MIKGNKFIVTGGAGFIGSHLVDTLVEEGAGEVVCIDDESAKSNNKFYWNSKATNIKRDICKYGHIEPFFTGTSAVFHLAAEARIQPSINNPLGSVRTNVVGTSNVLQASYENNVKNVIYSSTSSSYGKNNPLPFKESMPTQCLTPYSVSKVCGEELCRVYSELMGLNTVSLRYFNVYGDRQPLKGVYAPVVGLFMRQVKNGVPMTVVGDGKQTRDFTHIKDVVRANLFAFFALPTEAKVSGEVINIGTGKNHSILSIAECLGDGIEFIPKRKGEAKHTLADNTKAKNLLGWRPTVDIKDWIREENVKHNTDACGYYK